MLIATVSAVPGMIVRPEKVTATWASSLRLRTITAPYYDNEDAKMWTGLIWLRMGTCGWLL